VSPSPRFSWGRLTVLLDINVWDVLKKTFESEESLKKNLEERVNIWIQYIIALLFDTLTIDSVTVLYHIGS